MSQMMAIGSFSTYQSNYSVLYRAYVTVCSCSNGQSLKWSDIHDSCAQDTIRSQISYFRKSTRPTIHDSTRFKENWAVDLAVIA